jgi:hypothetical protein
MNEDEISSRITQGLLALGLSRFFSVELVVPADEIAQVALDADSWEGEALEAYQEAIVLVTQEAESAMDEGPEALLFEEGLGIAAMRMLNPPQMAALEALAEEHGGMNVSMVAECFCCHETEARGMLLTASVAPELALCSLGSEPLPHMAMAAEAGLPTMLDFECKPGMEQEFETMVLLALAEIHARWKAPVDPEVQSGAINSLRRALAV